MKNIEPALCFNPFALLNLLRSQPFCGDLALRTLFIDMVALPQRHAARSAETPTYIFAIS